MELKSAIRARRATEPGMIAPNPLDQTSTSLLQIAFPWLIWNLVYATPGIHNFCRHAENRLASACLSFLGERGDFRTGRQLRSGRAAYRA